MRNKKKFFWRLSGYSLRKISFFIFLSFAAKNSNFQIKAKLNNGENTEANIIRRVALRPILSAAAVAAFKYF